MERKDFTLLVYKFDKRTKAGRKMVGIYDYVNQDAKWMAEEIRELHNTVCPADKYEIELHETYVTSINAMTGEEFKERFDTPYYASPRSETYWSS